FVSTRATKFTNVGGVVTESFISVDTSSLVGGGGTISISSFGNLLDTTAITFRWYVGTFGVPGGYTNFVELTPSQMATRFPAARLGRLHTFGSVTAGTGGLTRVFCYDRVLKSWTIIDLPYAISVLKQVRAVGTIPITVTGGFNDGTVRRLQSNDPTFDGTAV